MSRRLSMIPPALLLGVCLVLLPACKKKRPTEDEGGGGGGGGPVAGAPPAAVSSEYVAFARLDAKSIRDSALLAEVKQAVVKGVGAGEWDKVDGDAGKEFGVKLTDIETATVVVTEVPARGEPKVVIILTAKAPFQKVGAFGLKADARPDSRGFYKTAGFTLVHFPNDKTAVAVSPELADKYLDGYAKGAAGWPLTADLTRAAGNHTLFATLNVSQLTASMPAEAKQQYADLLAAKTVTLAADLKGRELSATVRGTFPDAAAAGKAKEQVAGFVGLAGGFVDQAASGKGPPEAAEFLPAIKQAQQALKGMKIDVTGSDVVATASYKADFDIGQMVAGAVKKVQASAGRMTAQNNLKQIGLALHNYHDAMNRLPIHAVGANGMPLRNPTDKPLLSWRVAILPYIEQENLYKQFKLDEPWDGPNNKKLIAQMPKIFAPVEKPGKPGFTHLQMIVGPGGMPLTGMTIAQIPDGSSNTVAVVEAADPVEWTKPADVTLPPKFAPGELKKKFGGQFAGGINVTMWDGSVRFIPETVSERTLTLLFDPRDGNVIPGDWLSSPTPMGKK